MPIRFACPHCRQKLSVAQRKAGTSADCPRCKRSLTIPQPPPQITQVASQLAANGAASSKPATAVDSFLVAEAMPPTENARAVSGEATVDEPLGEEAVFTPDADGFEGLELVYDVTNRRPSPLAPPVQADVIAVPRYVVYLQGGLLAVVALVAFAIGLLAGSTVLPPSTPAGPQACLVSGSVIYTVGPRSRPDEGAVIVLIPQAQHRPDERAPVSGLRPSDPSPDSAHRGLAILRELGGGYVRTDTKGRFQLELPSRGRYLLLVISHEKRLRLAGEINTADIRKLSPYFDNAADLLGDHRYQLTQETIRGDRQLAITFE